MFLAPFLGAALMNERPCMGLHDALGACCSGTHSSSAHGFHHTNWMVHTIA